MSTAPETTLVQAPGRTGGIPLLAVVAVVAAAHLAFVVARLAVFGGDPSGFVAAGDLLTDPAHAPDSLLVTPGVDGYDGQAYYRLARDPLTDEISAHGIEFTRPAYWQTRIGYPAAAWLLSAGGQEALVPAAMLLVNVLAVIGLALLAASVARRLGRSPWWGVVPATWGGYVVGVGQDLTEPLAGLLLLVALVALRSRQHAVAALALTAAALTRETTLVVALAVLVAAVVARRTAPPWWVAAAPLGVYAAWRTWIRGRWPETADPLTGSPPSDNPLGPPLVELAGHLRWAVGHPGSEWPNLLLLLPTLVALGVAASALAHRGGPLHERLALAAYLVVLLCLPVWDRGQAYLRWGSEPILLGWLLLLGAPGRRRLAAVAVLTVLVFVLAATQSLGYPRTDGAWGSVWSWS